MSLLAGHAMATLDNAVPRWPLNALSPAGIRGRLSILIYHRVHQRPDPLFPEGIDAHRFIVVGFHDQGLAIYCS